MKLFTAMLDYWTLNILDISDTISRSIVRHEFLDTDGAELQDIGARARYIRFRSYWFNNIAEGTTTTYEQHFDFVNWLGLSQRDASGQVKKLTFIHPKYGTIIGYVENFTIVHDDTQDYCSIDIDFVEHGLKDASNPPSKTWLELNTDQVKLLNDTITYAGVSLKGLGFGSVIGRTLNEAIKKVQQISEAVSVATRTFVDEVDKNLTAINGFLSFVPDIANTVDNAVSWGSDIPSAILRPMNNAVNRIYTSLENISNSPLLFVNNAIIQLESLSNTITGTNANFFKTQLASIGAGSLLERAARLLTNDQNKTNTMTTSGFDINGLKISPVTIGAMSRQDIESMMQSLQVYTQYTLILNRQNPALRKMMADLNNYVNYRKMSRLSVKEIYVSNQPMHCLLLSLGQSYQLADAYLSMNSLIKNPAYVEGKVKVYG
jgi:prophage DNA circulation protein